MDDLFAALAASRAAASAAAPPDLRRYAALAARERALARFLATNRGRYCAEWAAGHARIRAELARLERRMGHRLAESDDLVGPPA